MASPDDKDMLRGFRAPVTDAQAVFDRAMRAFSRPGTIVDFGERLGAPAPLEPAAAALLATLADYDTPLWLHEALRGETVRGWIAFQTGAVVMDRPELSRFALVPQGADLPALSSFAIGTATYPDRSTTLILGIAALDGGAPYLLAGPGIETTTRFAPRGLPDTFLADWAINQALFPRGVDVILACGTRALALPRTTQIRRA
ncbi:carbon-phosphorus lyase subunit PhnH [Aureimonas endophytica]|uniref:Carbon-phosphorus lyase subunit PhnH n=1 Tax=Aureimonas endophytica TaxID=2027858 RepID=A0A916ZH45_9HYPH|nr:phosphonate C-P lyase system protein PhnH [Aureimonas endophytica]GGD97778.1 carbon-phosphorus lyase subunit PhnH [Aureimonas endophytica]